MIFAGTLRCLNKNQNITASLPHRPQLKPRARGPEAASVVPPDPADSCPEGSKHVCGLSGFTIFPSHNALGTQGEGTD